MPFESQAQRGYMYSQHPEMAKKFEAETPKGKKLPKHVKKKRSMGHAIAGGGMAGRGKGY